MNLLRGTKIFVFSAMLACSGCHSLNKPGSASFASVVISNCNPTEIQGAAARVFIEEGYATVESPGGGLICEREGSRKQEIVHGSWPQHGSIRERVRVEIVPLVDGTHRLQCKAYMVRDAGDSFFEEEVKLKNIRSGPYQTLLEKAAGRLRGK